ncbi:MAG: hypothetical protein NVSMB27_49030 [Ktedonobacteraceae bacterium]
MPTSNNCMKPIGKAELWSPDLYYRDLPGYFCDPERNYAIIEVLWLHRWSNEPQESLTSLQQL